MANKKEFGEGIIFTASNYIFWFLLSNFYFWLMNIPFIFVLFLMAASQSDGFTLLLIISALPMGPALTALLSIMGKLVREKDVNVTKDFFKAYKVNFFESFYFSLLEVVLLSICFVDIMYAKAKFPQLQPVFMIIGLIIIGMNFYLFPIISRFYLKKIDTIKLTFVYFFKRIHVCIICFAVIYIIWSLLAKTSAVVLMVLLFSMSILCYVTMVFQNKMLLQIEEKLNENK